MTRHTLMLATVLISAAIAAPVLAQGAATTAPATPAPMTTAPTTTTPMTAVPAPATMPRLSVVSAVDPMKIDLAAVGRGMRTSKVVGMSVVNDAGDTVGTVDDLIVMPNETVPYAVLSVGGFLGMGAHYVVVPYALLEANGTKLRLPKSTKESLKALPSFVYPA